MHIQYMLMLLYYIVHHITLQYIIVSGAFHDFERRIDQIQHMQVYIYIYTCITIIS